VGESAALASAFLWALSNILMGSLSGRVPAVVISALRTLFSTAFLAAVALLLFAAGTAGRLSMPRALALAGCGILGPGVGDTLYIGSLGRVGVSRALPVSTAAYPLMTFVLAVVLLGEQVTARVAAGTLLIVIGVWLVMSRPRTDTRSDEPLLGTRELWIGMLLVGAASLLWAASSVWLRSAAAGVGPVLAAAIRMPAALIVVAAVVRGVGHDLWPRRYGQRCLNVLIVTGVLGTGIGSLLFVVAVQQAGASKAAILSSTAPLFALPMAGMLLGERVTARIAVGTALSIAGIWLVV
jgi:DME family drug/metabolite transporter